MTMLEAENQNLRRRMRELELEFQGLQKTHTRVLKEKQQAALREAIPQL